MHLDDNLTIENVPINRLVSNYSSYLSRLIDRELSCVRFETFDVEFYIETVERHNRFLEEERKKRERLEIENQKLRSIIDNKRHRHKLPKELTQAQTILLQIKSKFKLFDDIGDSELLSILNNIAVKKYESDEVIFSQGEGDYRIFYVVKGSVDISIKSDDKSEKVAELGVKSFFGEMAFINRQPRIASATTSKDPTILLSFFIEESVKAGTEDIHLKLYQNINRILSAKIESSNRNLIQK